MAINLAIEIESIDIRHTADVVDDGHDTIGKILCLDVVLARNLL